MNEKAKQPVGVIGLGLLGTALAERLLNDGYRVRVYNRTREKAEPLVARGAEWSDNPLTDCERIVISLYTTDVVEQVLTHLGVDSRQDLTAKIFIDTTTGSPNESAALGARLAERGMHYLESPIAASSEQTRRGEALAIVGGSLEVFEACNDLFECMTAKSFHVGAWGSAAKTKLVNNLVLGLTRAALGEGLVFAEAIGLDPAQTLAVLKEGNAYSVVMDVKGQKMVEGDFSVQARLSQHNKDVGLILEQGAQAGVSLPLSTLHRELLDRAEAEGLGELDNCVIIRMISPEP